jgi:hypothetical protein
MELYNLLFKTNSEVFFNAGKPFIVLQFQHFAILFLHFESEIRFVSLCFLYFLSVFDRGCFYFHFDLSEVRKNKNVSFRYQNELKIMSK